MIIFICIYLLIGLVIQLLGQFWAAKDINNFYKSADLMDLVLFEQNPDVDENKKRVNDQLNKKRWIIVNTLLWPVSIMITLVLFIKVCIILK